MTGVASRVSEITPPPSAGGSRVINTDDADIDMHVERAPRIVTWGLNYKPHKNLIIARKTSPASTNPLIFLHPKSPIKCLFVDAAFGCGAALT